MERLGRITTSLPDLPIDRRMTYGDMRRAIIGYLGAERATQLRTEAAG